MDFNDFEWHDSILINLNIDGHMPENKSKISMDIDWYDTPPSTIIFENVYKTIMHMNFGVVAPESINYGYTSEIDPMILKKLQENFPHIDSGKVNCYNIEFSSTASKIVIVAESFRIQANNNIQKSKSPLKIRHYLPYSNN